MNDYDYKEEALKLRKKRNLILSPICIKIHNDIIYQLEKKISEFSENLEDYKKRINKILVKLNKMIYLILNVLMIYMILIIHF